VRCQALKDAGPPASTLGLPLISSTTVAATVAPRRPYGVPNVAIRPGTCRTFIALHDIGRRQIGDD